MGIIEPHYEDVFFYVVGDRWTKISFALFDRGGHSIFMRRNGPTANLVMDMLAIIIIRYIHEKHIHIL